MTTPNDPHTPGNGKNSDSAEGAVFPAYAGGGVGEPQAEKKSVIAICSRNRHHCAGVFVPSCSTAAAGADWHHRLHRRIAKR